MKYRLLGACATAICCTAAPAFGPVFAQGLARVEVLGLQQQLRDDGCGVSHITGRIDATTRAAVKQCESKYSGATDPSTMLAAMDIGFGNGIPVPTLAQARAGEGGSMSAGGSSGLMKDSTVRHDTTGVDVNKVTPMTLPTPPATPAEPALPPNPANPTDTAAPPMPPSPPVPPTQPTPPSPPEPPTPPIPTDSTTPRPLPIPPRDTAKVPRDTATVPRDTSTIPRDTSSIPKRDTMPMPLPKPDTMPKRDTMPNRDMKPNTF